MLRLLARGSGQVALAVAFAEAVMDGARSIANARLSLTQLGATLERIAPVKYAQLPAMAAHIDARLWDPVLIHLLLIPTSLCLAAVAFALMALGAPRR
jgi:hypothetical protein